MKILIILAASFMFIDCVESGKEAVKISCETQADYYVFYSQNVFDVWCPHACSHRVVNHVWGSTIYTADSSICRAAIHDGWITDDGGSITVYKQPGRQRYEASDKNSVKTLEWPRSWTASFTFAPIDVTLSCGVKADDERFADDVEFEVECPPNCSSKSQFNVWGNEIYTDDSSVCRAAIHDDKLTDEGGIVTVYRQPGLHSYEGTTSNSVTTMTYASWGGSFTFVQIENDCLIRPDYHSYGNLPISSNLTMNCPANCHEEPYRVWGSAVYTDDSNVCAAAIHHGEITASGGGQVIIRILSGREVYTGTSVNGITTLNYGNWGRSFMFIPSDLQ